jgi:hypothetical protein
MSGAVTDRSALHDALEFARSGDTLILWKLDRLARLMKQLINTVEAHGKRVRRHRRREINGHKDSVVGMIVFVPCGLVPIGIEPFTYLGHRGRKLSGAYSDRDAPHNPSEWVSQT